MSINYPGQTAGGFRRPGKAQANFKAKINRKKKNRVLERIRKASRKINWIILLFPFFLHGQDSIDCDSLMVDMSIENINCYQDTIPAALYILENGEEKMISGYTTGNLTIFLDAKKRRVKVTKFRL